MSILSFFGRLSTIHIIVHTFLYGTKVGVDGAGHVYYRGRPRKGTKTERRWVQYNGAPEASAIEPGWHGWVHHQTDLIPTESGFAIYKKPWQKPHVPNPTGTKDCYLPPALKGGVRQGSTGDYTAWNPSHHS